MTLKVIEGLVGGTARPTATTNPAEANPVVQASQHSAQVAAAHATLGSGDAVVSALRAAGKVIPTSDRIRTPEEARLTTERVAEKIKGDNESTDAHAGLDSPNRSNSARANLVG